MIDPGNGGLHVPLLVEDQVIDADHHPDHACTDQQERAKGSQGSPTAGLMACGFRASGRSCGEWSTLSPDAMLSATRFSLQGLAAGLSQSSALQVHVPGANIWWPNLFVDQIVLMAQSALSPLMT